MSDRDTSSPPLSIHYHSRVHNPLLFNTRRLQRLRYTPLDTRLAQTRNDQRRALLIRRPANREELGQECVLAKVLLNQIDRHAPPSAQRREHPKVRRGLDAHGDAAALAVAGARDVGRAAIVCEQAAGDRAADCEGRQAGGQHDVACRRGERAGPGEYGQDHEPGGQFGEVRVH